MTPVTVRFTVRPGQGAVSGFDTSFASDYRAALAAICPLVAAL